MTPLLASRLARDPDRTFERLYRKHVRDVYTFSLGILGNPDDAEDVTQTTFMNAYRGLSRTGRIENPRAWLVAIAHNVCRQRFRTAARRPQEVELGHEVAESLVEDEPPPAADEIRAALNQLAFNQRTVLVLREIEGFSYAEIAELMGLSVSAVETLLFRARRALREQLEAAERPLACPDAERLISRQLDGRLSRHDRGQLRAHLRACPGCAAYARSQRAQKKAMRGLALIPLPAALTDAFASSLGAGVATKAATVAVAAVVGTGIAVGTGVVKPPLPGLAGPDVKAESAPRKPAPTADGAAPVASVVALEHRASRADERMLALERARPLPTIESPSGALAAEEAGGAAEPAVPAEAATPAEAGTDAEPATPATPAEPAESAGPTEETQGEGTAPADSSSPPPAAPPPVAPPPAAAVDPPPLPPGSITPPKAKAPDVAPGLGKKIVEGKKVPTLPAASQGAQDKGP